jgi:hypothetical protein
LLVVAITRCSLPCGIVTGTVISFGEIVPEHVFVNRRCGFVTFPD